MLLQDGVSVLIETEYAGVDRVIIMQPLGLVKGVSVWRGLNVWRYVRGK